MTLDPPILPPLDPNVAPDRADADIERMADYLRRRLAEGKLSPSRKRLIKHELRVIVERLAA